MPEVLVTRPVRSGSKDDEGGEEEDGVEENDQLLGPAGQSSKIMTLLPVSWN